MPFWNTTSTTLANNEMYVNNTYKNSAGNNALTTITATNKTGYVPIDSASTDPIVKKLSYAVQTDGKITYQYDDGTGNKIQYNSIQQIANDFGISGYTAGTTAKIKNSMQENLTAAANTYNQQNPDQKIGPATAPSVPAATPDTVGGITPEEIKAAGADVVNIDIPGKNAQTAGYMGTHVYPSDLRSNKQDRLKFTLYESLGADISAKASEIFKSDFSGKVISQRRSTTSLGEVYLPIQPSITDSNNVDWSGTSLNAFEAAGFAKSLDLMGKPNVTSAAGSILNDVKEAAKLLAGGNNPVAQTLKILLAQEAMGIQGVLSRATGAVLNPNLELLFNGPMLRPFNFTFRLSPRDKPEADEVRKIIRFFKEAMSVRTASSNVFLKTPNVFDIQFQVGENNSPHKSLPRIKRCALLSCDVDYTPDGTYMTYLDAAKTLTSYQLSLRFSELEPIYDSDYKTIPRDEIGF